MDRDRPLATILAAIAGACGKDLDIDTALRTWGHHIPEPPFDPDANAAAILAGFGG
ncbi:hypothetical protein [Schlesneria paludicola]